MNFLSLMAFRGPAAGIKSVRLRGVLLEMRQTSVIRLARRKAWSLFLVAVLLSIWGRASALDPTHDLSQYRHNAWTIQDGYLQATPYAIGQTTDGYLWIGTGAGLVRFDGVKFSPWRPPSAQLPEGPAIITALLGARDGTLWFAQITNLGAKPALYHWTGRKLESHATSVLAYPITQIVETHKGDVWAAGPLCHVVGTALHCDAPPWLSGVRSTAIAEDAEGTLWVGTNAGLLRWNSTGSKLYKPPGFNQYASTDLMSVVAAPDGTVWVGTSRPGLGLMHFSQGKWSSEVAPGVDSSHWDVGALLLDREGVLWVGTDNEGLYRVSAKTVEHFRQSDGLSSDFIIKLFEDSEGDLWLVTAKGIDRFRDTRVVAFSKQEGLCSQEADSVMVSRDGTLWVGGDGALTAFRDRKASCIGEGKGLPGNQVTSLFEDHRGQLWVGVDDRMYIDNNRTFTAINRQAGSPTGMIVSMTEDAEQNLWLVSAGRHRSLLRIRGHNVAEEVALPQDVVPHEVAADPRGGLWLGLVNGDLAHYRSGHVDVVHFGHAGESIVKQLAVNPDGSVLAATGAGLLGWKNGRHQILNHRNGLPCDPVGAFITDDAGSLWLSLTCGFVEIPNNELRRWWDHPGAVLRPRLVLDSLDGWQPGWASFREESAKTPDGRLWFPEAAGVAMIDPQRLASNEPELQVHVDDVLADQRHYPPSPSLRLPRFTRNLEIDYTAPSFAIPQRVHFRYHLDGFDHEWQDVGTRREAVYTNLGPGHYTFRVIASKRNGVWSTNGASVEFTIPPAFFQTRWFYALCAIACMALLTALYRVRVRQVAARVRGRLEARLAERERVARELHDTLLQSFQGVVLRFRTVQKLLPTRLGEAVETLESAIEQARAAIREGREAVQGLRSSPIEAEDFVEALRRLGEELASDPSHERSTALTLSIEGTPRALQPPVCNDIYRIASEALRNAYRHAEASRIEVQLDYSTGRFELRIRDNGKGVNPDFLDNEDLRGHFGLSGMRERAVEIGGKLSIWSAPDSGTELQLSLSGSIAYGTDASKRRSWPVRAHR